MVQDRKQTDCGMTLRYPATRWQDALPAGSGVVGALMYGQIQNDTVVLNHDALYYPQEKNKPFVISNLLPDIRQLIAAGRGKEAEQLMLSAYQKQTGRSSGGTSMLRAPYQPFCAIELNTHPLVPFTRYRRGIDFSTGRTWVQWAEGETVFTRELFVSRDSDRVFLRIRGNRPGVVNGRISLRAQRDEQVDPKLWGGRGAVHIPDAERNVLNNCFLTWGATYPNGLNFGATGCVTSTGGRVWEEAGGLAFEDADEVVLQLNLFIGENPCVSSEQMKNVFFAETRAFEEEFKIHAALHGELFERMSLDLGGGEPFSNEEMLLTAYDGEVPVSLIQTMAQFGRYLLISSSREGGLPANLQGLWNGDYSPAWNSDIHTNINVQMNYWQALSGAVPEIMIPFFDYFEKYLNDFRANAWNLFACRGIFVPTAMTTDGLEVSPGFSCWTAGAGWIAQHFFDYWLFTGDVKFLRERAVPWLMETALFYEDFLMEGEDGVLLFSPSISPENWPAGTGSILSMNATMDIAICREVLTNLCSACEQLGIESAGVERWRILLNKLPEYGVNEEGALKEWLHPDFKDQYNHRHLSHLYPVFPGFEVTKNGEKELFEACRIAAEKRLVTGLSSQVGWSLALLAGVYSRLGEGDRALECLEILTRSNTGPNLLTYCSDWRDMGLSLCPNTFPPFMIDANCGVSAVVMEMLVFSRPGLIQLLPALPVKWPKGRISGVACRGGITVVDMEWDRGANRFSATLLSQSDQQVTIRMSEPFGGCLPEAGLVFLRKGIPFHLES